MPGPHVDRIVSGGQTGVDQAALQAAIDLGIPHGGWCPKGRRCEQGVIPARFQMVESHSARYEVRTEQNVVDADGTLILYQHRLQGGTRLTARLARQLGRPCLLVELSKADPQRVRDWLQQQPIRTLNVAGPRASSSPDVHHLVYRFLITVFRP